MQSWSFKHFKINQLITLERLRSPLAIYNHLPVPPEKKKKNILTFQTTHNLVLSSCSHLSVCSKTLHQFEHQDTERHLGQEKE